MLPEMDGWNRDAAVQGRGSESSVESAPLSAGRHGDPTRATGADAESIVCPPLTTVRWLYQSTGGRRDNEHGNRTALTRTSA